MSIEFGLYTAELMLPELLDDERAWKSLHIDYHPPVVERLWRDLTGVSPALDGHRLSIHRIHPCESGEAFLHPHKWPGAFRVWGRYEMKLGWSDTNEPPKESMRIITYPGTVYTMTDPNVWHSVRPIDGPVLSVMLTGKPWDREMPLEPSKPLKPLSAELRGQLDFDIRELHRREFKS